MFQGLKILSRPEDCIEGFLLKLNQWILLEEETKLIKPFPSCLRLSRNEFTCETVHMKVSSAYMLKQFCTKTRFETVAKKVTCKWPITENLSLRI